MGLFVQHRQHVHFLSRLYAILNQIIAPDVVGILRPPFDLAFFAVASLDSLASGQLQPFLSLHAFNPVWLPLCPSRCSSAVMCDNHAVDSCAMIRFSRAFSAANSRSRCSSSRIISPKRLFQRWMAFSDTAQLRATSATALPPRASSRMRMIGSSLRRLPCLCLLMRWFLV